MNKNTLFICHIESLDTRYTSQLRKYLPEQLQNGLGDKYDIVNIDGTDIGTEVCAGAFLDFVGTNIYKSTQSVRVSELIANGGVKNGDIFFYTDAWCAPIIQLRYTLDLMGIKAKIAGFWHSGSYDPGDFLCRLIQNKNWSYNFERALFHAIDYNFFATDFHIKMFIETLFERHGDGHYVSDGYAWAKAIRAGLPLDYLQKELAPYTNLPKRNLILFPHRIAPEKQVDIFRDLARELPQYEFIVAQDKRLSKHEYHTLLGESKMIFSANLQETLGISAFEGAICGAFPYLPARLSYKEMYDDNYKYPSEWTICYEAYVKNREKIKNDIIYRMNKYDEYQQELPQLIENVSAKFFSSQNIINTFKNN